LFCGYYGCLSKPKCAHLEPKLQPANIATTGFLSHTMPCLCALFDPYCTRSMDLQCLTGSRGPSILFGREDSRTMHLNNNLYAFMHKLVYMRGKHRGGGGNKLKHGKPQHVLPMHTWNPTHTPHCINKKRSVDLTPRMVCYT
jgi:hypothetical protein